MRYTTKQYATALFEALEGAIGMEERRACLQRFVDLLRARKNKSRMPYILAAVERIYCTKHRLHTVTAETVSGAPHSLKKNLEEMLGTSVALSERIDPSLVAGIKLYIDGDTLIDASASTMLRQMFHHS